MDSCHRVCWGSLPFRHPVKAVFVQVFFITPVCHQLALLFLHPISSLRLLCTDFLAHSLIFCLPTTSFSLVWPIGSRCCRSSFIPISSAYLCASCTRDRRPVHVLLSLQTLVLVPLLDLGLYTNGEILVILYSASNDFIPRPPEFLGR